MMRGLALVGVNCSRSRHVLFMCLLVTFLTLVSSRKHHSHAKRLSTDVASDKKVICYFPSWFGYRQGAGKFTPEDIDPSLCTHIMYAFAGLDKDTLTIKALDSFADIDKGFYDKVVALKEKGTKVLISIGGWNESEGDKYSRLVNDAKARRRFIDDLIKFMVKYGFQGAELDWEYPKCWQGDCTKGPASDKKNFAALVRELAKAFKSQGFLLSAAVSANRNVIAEAYDVPTLSKYLDWIGVMSYDYHVSTESFTGQNAPLYHYPGETPDYFNVNDSINSWIAAGADRKKLVMGMPFYGQSFTLADPNQHGIHAKASGPGVAGVFSGSAGTLTYTEICSNITKVPGWNVVHDDVGRVSHYAYRLNQWVSYDDVSDIRRKCQYLKMEGLGGAMVWSLGADDFTNLCGCGRQPLLSTIGHELRGLPVETKDCT